MTEPRASQARQAHLNALLAERFVTLADSLVADYDVVELLEGLVHSCVDLLDIEQSGLLLTDQRGNLQVVAASSEATRIVEVLQLQSDEGPCLECVMSGAPVRAPDLASQAERWPTFVPAAMAVGFSAVHALPLRLRNETIGGLNLFSSAERSPLSEDDLRIAQALADVATIGILQQRSISRASLLAEQLQTALNSRIVVEQAKGILAERGDLEMEAAFARLRAYARARSELLSDVAGRVVREKLSADAVLQGSRDL